MFTHTNSLDKTLSLIYPLIFVNAWRGTRLPLIQKDTLILVTYDILQHIGKFPLSSLVTSQTHFQVYVV